MSDSTDTFQKLATLFDNATSAFVITKADAIIVQLQPLAVSGVTLYITLLCFLILAGKIDTPFSEFCIKSFKIILVTAIALNTATYIEWVVGSVNGLTEGLSKAMGHTKNADIYENLDKTIDRALELVNLCMVNAKEAGWDLGEALEWTACWIIIIISTSCIVLVGGALLLGATIMMKVNFAIGPLFILCAIWPVTQKFFETWCADTLKHVLEIVLTVALLTIAINIYSDILRVAKFGDDENGLWVCVQVGIIALLLSWLFLQISSKAAALAGGIGMQAMGVRAMISNAAAPYLMTKNAIKTVANVVNPTYTKRDMKSGMLTSGSRFQHWGAGNTLWNPAYRQAIRQNFGENWGRRKGGSAKEGGSS